MAFLVNGSLLLGSALADTTVGLTNRPNIELATVPANFIV